MPLPRVSFELGPFAGMRYLSNFKKWDPRYLLEAQDAFPTPEGNYSVRCADNAVSPTSASASAAIQGEVIFRQADGTNLDLIALNGELWKRTAGDFTKVLSTANLTSASATLNSAGRVYLTVFNNAVVASDGTHTPFSWDGTTSAGVTTLTNAPVFYGPPTVYYAKLFGAKNTERDTIVWSEENSPTTGYEAGGFNNSWQLTQSGSGPIRRLLGRNEALYYWRQQSIGSIRGAVTTDFTAAGVHDDVSQEVGTTAPESVIEYEGYIWFVDSQGRPYRYAPGGALEPIWQNIAALFVHGGTDQGIGTVGERAMVLTPTDIALTYAAPLPFHRAAVFGWRAGGTYFTRTMAFSVDTGESLCGITPQAVSGGMNVTHMAAGQHASLDYPCLVMGGLKSSNSTVQLVSFGAPTSAYRAGVSCQFWTPSFTKDSSVVLKTDQLNVGVIVGPGVSATCSVTASISPNAGFNRPTGSYTTLQGPIILSAISAPSNRIATWGLSPTREATALSLQVGIDTNGSAVAGLASIRLDAWVAPRHPLATGA